MRTHVWAAALLVVAVGFALRSPAAPVIVAGNRSSVTAATQPSFFKNLTTTNLLTPASTLASFFAPTPKFGTPLGVAMTPPVPMTNGVPNSDYFKMFNLQVAPRSPK